MGLRVALLINGLGAGGAERSTAEMLPYLVEAGIEPIVICLYHRSEGVEESVIARGFDVRFIRERRIPGRVRAVRRVLSRDAPDLLHTVHFESDLIGRLAAVGTSIPVMSSLVNTSYSDVRLRDPRVRPWKLRVVRTVDGWTGRHLTDHFHAISNPVKQASAKALRVSPQRVTVVERGRESARLGVRNTDRAVEARRQLGLGADDEVIVNVARQEYQKGQRFLLEASALLLKTRPRLRVLIAGRTGNVTPELQRAKASLGLDDQVEFLGHRDDIPTLLSAADVFAFPSLYEGLGGALLEALALEAPIVASDLPVIRDFIQNEESGLLVPPESPTALAEAIARLLEDQQLARSMARRGREIFESRFTIDRSVEGMVDLYKRIGRRPEASS
jgi:glycosyltransferase involved in cell wall biosynthesis